MNNGDMLKHILGMLGITNDAQPDDRCREAIIAILLNPQNPTETLHAMKRQQIEWAKRPEIQPGRRMLGPNGVGDRW